jgi:hypothetical protein
VVDVRWNRRVLLALAVAGGLESALVRLGRTSGSTAAERGLALPGDGIVPAPQVVTDHAVTLAAAPEDVWPWLVQMGWHRGGWYTARWVDRLLFPANLPSADRVLPDLQEVAVGSFIPDGAPETRCGFVVEELDPPRALVLHSTSHLPATWRDRGIARLDWSWAFALRPTGDGGTRLQVRSRWFTAVGRLAVVPADYVMAGSMLRGLRRRVAVTG